MEGARGRRKSWLYGENVTSLLQHFWSAILRDKWRHVKLYCAQHCHDGASIAVSPAELHLRGGGGGPLPPP